jgi:hypothetical protein
VALVMAMAMPVVLEVPADVATVMWAEVPGVTVHCPLVRWAGER